MALARSRVAAPLIVFEGPEGSGKSTQAVRLSTRLRSEGIPVLLTRDPGGTAIGDKIRSLLLDSTSDALLGPTEAFLYAAARAQLVGEVIRPALEAGTVVISDRFVDSSLVYQGIGRGLTEAVVAAIQPLATGGLEPNLRILLDLPVGIGLARRFATAEVNRLDREVASFHEAVRQGFLDRAAADGTGWVVLDGQKAEDDVAYAVYAEVWWRLGSPLSAAKQRVEGR